ncbi:MAG: Shedu anti-phage system protein SduA domain-containing protein, partial [Byssovorax sp.]
GKKSKRDWHRRLNGGYSQLVDWFWLLSDVEHSKTLRDQFPNFHDFTGMLVIGRDHYLDQQELARLDWRAMNSKINGRAILFMTYDGLFRRVRDEADALRRYGGR